MVVLDWSVWFFLVYIFKIQGPHTFVLLHRVFDVLVAVFSPCVEDVFIREVASSCNNRFPRSLMCSVMYSWAVSSSSVNGRVWNRAHLTTESRYAIPNVANVLLITTSWVSTSADWSFCSVRSTSPKSEGLSNVQFVLVVFRYVVQDSFPSTCVIQCQDFAVEQCVS